MTIGDRTANAPASRAKSDSERIGRALDSLFDVYKPEGVGIWLKGAKRYLGGVSPIQALIDGRVLDFEDAVDHGDALNIREAFVCPFCRREALGPHDMCGGSFADADHPSVVRPLFVEFDGDALLPEHEKRLADARATYTAASTRKEGQ